MKKIIILLLIFLFSMTLSSCQKTNYEVPFILYDEEDLFMMGFRDSIFANNSSEITFKMYDSINSQIIQNEIINEVLKNSPKLIIVNPVDRLGAYTIIEKSKLSETPIIFINREPLATDFELWDKVYYVGAKPEQSAIYQAELVMELFGGNPNDLNDYDLNGDGKIQCIILKGQEGHQDAEIRTEYVVNEMEKNGYDLDVLKIESADFRTSDAFDVMNELLPIYRDQIEVIFSNNDAMAIGAINALKEDGFFTDDNLDGKVDSNTINWIPVVGIDGIEEAIQLIEDGYLYGTVINDSESMAKAVIELSNAIFNDREPDTISYTIVLGKYIWIDYEKYSQPIVED